MPATRSAHPPSPAPTLRRGIGVGNGIGVGKRPSHAGPSIPPAAPDYDDAFPASGATSTAAVAAANAADFEIDPTEEDLLDPEILAIAQAVAQAEAASEDVDAGVNEEVSAPEHEAGEGPDVEGEGEGEGGMEDGDDDIHPALREIVKSLTNAQQQSSDETAGDTMIDPNLQAAQDEAELHATLANLGSHHFSNLFPSTFSHTEDSNFLLPEPSPVAGPSSTTHADIPNDLVDDVGALYDAEPSESSLALGTPADGVRRRGRPKGSKNKIQRPPIRKPTPPPKPPKPPKMKKQAAKVGRPRKVRSAEEEEKFERKVAERKAGVRRPRGRPRMFPGHLVRELRLRANRNEFGRLKREAWENAEYSEHSSNIGIDGAERQEGDEERENGEGEMRMEVDEEGYYVEGGAPREPGHMDNYDWSNDPQNLLQGLAQAGEIHQIHPSEADQPDRQEPLDLDGGVGERLGERAERALTEVLGLRGEHAEMAE